MRNKAGCHGIIQLIALGLLVLATVSCEASFQAVFLKNAVSLSRCDQGDITFLLEYRVEMKRLGGMRQAMS